MRSPIERMVDAAVHCVCCGAGKDSCECWELKDGRYQARIRCEKGCFKCGLHCKHAKHAKVDTIVSTVAILLACLTLLAF